MHIVAHTASLMRFFASLALVAEFAAALLCQPPISPLGGRDACCTYCHASVIGRNLFVVPFDKTRSGRSSSLSVQSSYRLDSATAAVDKFLLDVTKWRSLNISPGLFHFDESKNHYQQLPPPVFTLNEDFDPPTFLGKSEEQLFADVCRMLRI
jgi:hypothetical protein